MRYTSHPILCLSTWVTSSGGSELMMDGVPPGYHILPPDRKYRLSSKSRLKDKRNCRVFAFRTYFSTPLLIGLAHHLARR